MSKNNRNLIFFLMVIGSPKGLWGSTYGGGTGDTRTGAF